MVDSSNELLPIQFHSDPGDGDPTDLSDLPFNDSINLLNEYLDLARLDAQVGNIFNILVSHLVHGHKRS